MHHYERTNFSQGMLFLFVALLLLGVQHALGTPFGPTQIRDVVTQNVQLEKQVGIVSDVKFDVLHC
jgi:hypothetical protein